MELHLTQRRKKWAPFYIACSGDISTVVTQLDLLRVRHHTLYVAEKIEVGPNLSFAVDNVSHGISFGVCDRGAQFGWVLSPVTVSRLAEALSDAVAVRKLKKRESSTPDAG